MNTSEVMPSRHSPTERRRHVELGVKAGKSNRAIARELGVDEGTVRRDRKFLATPPMERLVRVPILKKQRPVREVSPDERRRRHRQSLLEAAQLWITQERDMLLPHVEHVLDEAGKLLYLHGLNLRGIPISTKKPSELLVLSATELSRRRLHARKAALLCQMACPLARLLYAKGRRTAG